MKTIISLTFLLGFAGMTVLGFSMMDGHSMMHESGGCIGALFIGDCSNFKTETAKHQIAAFETLSTALSPIGIYQMFLFLLLALFFLFDKSPPPAAECSTNARKRAEHLDFFNGAFRHWIALFERSPSN